MSVATSFTYTVNKIPSSPSSSTPSSSSSLVRLCPSAKPFARRAFHVVRSSQTEGPIRRPSMAPSPTPPLNKPQPPPETAPPAPVSAPAKPVSAASVTADDKSVVTLEFQRVKAKELQEFFKQKKAEEANRGPFFGFVGDNEIGNGRWAMFGFAVGLLTEFATGSDLVDQVKILLSNFGIVDLE